MKLRTQFELAQYSKEELHCLYKETLTALMKSQRESQERCNALASLENISRELSMK